MCGIAAAVGGDAEQLAVAVERMCSQMVRRGPDDGGVETVAREPVAVVLGSRRLAIIDPSPAGHQPMHDGDRRTTIAFNGMIYNYCDLRERLIEEGERFNSTCDTEVVLRAYRQYGGHCVQHLRGMFAFAIWDGRTRQLFLARDRLGIKPLYVWRDGRNLLCASSVRALLATGMIKPTLSAEGIRSFLATGAVSEPATAIQGVTALPPGHSAAFKGEQLACVRYWSPPVDQLDIERGPAIDELKALLEDSVRRHMISDRPIGVFLSGGLDSSLLAALAVRAEADVETVSVDFEESGFSEQSHAAKVARHVGSCHRILTLTAGQLDAWLDDAFEAMDQPSFDGVNTYAVSRAAAEAGLTVALSGLGADELFDGYGYARRLRLLARAGSAPAPLRQAAAALAPLIPGSRGEKAAAWLEGPGPPEAGYHLLRALFPPRDLTRLLKHAPGSVLRADSGQASENEIARKLPLLDIDNYLRNVLLRDTDAMSMGNSLEVRVPYLDNPVVDWALRAPTAVKGERKQLLRVLGRELLPAEILARPKHGFALPLNQWIGSELRPQIENALLHPPEPLRTVLSNEMLPLVLEAHRKGRSCWLRPWALYSLCRWAGSLTNCSGGVTNGD